MSKISTMSAFLKTNAYLRWGCETSPVRAPAEKAAIELQKMVRDVNLKHRPLTVERFLDLAWYIRELRWASDGIAPKLANELVGLLNLEWERATAHQRVRACAGRKPHHGRP